MSIHEREALKRLDESPLSVTAAAVYAQLAVAEAINNLADAVKDHSVRIDNVTKDGRIQIDVFGEVST